MRVSPRLATKIRRSDGHWLWTGFRTSDGYGRVRVGTRVVGAHRAVWESIYGPLAPGEELDHRCNVRRCVRPSHLDPVSHQTNMLRAVERRPRCRRGHIFDRVWGRTYRRRVCSVCARLRRSA